jgi:ABC-type nitrate/sulfonate/bicarbonate transport system permease component
MWTPFLLVWPLPLWYPWASSFPSTFSIIFAIAVLTAAMAATRAYLISRCVLSLKEQAARWWLLRTALLQALLISIYAQLWLSPYDWHWYDFSVGGAYAASILVLLCVFAVERLMRADFGYVSDVRASAITREFEYYTRGTRIGSIAIGLSLIGIWEILSFSSLEMIISSPVTVLGASYHLLSTVNFWQHALLSLAEVCGGLICGTAISLILWRLLCVRDKVRTELLPILPLWNLTFFFSPVIFMEWLHEVSYTQKILGIGLVTIYPFVESAWGLRNRVSGLRWLLSIDSALPYAIVMMVFSEAMAGRAGIGLLLVTSHLDVSKVSEGIAVAMVTIGILLFVSLTLRSFGRRRYVAQEN